MCRYCDTVPCKHIKEISFFDNGEPKHIEFFRHDVIEAPQALMPSSLEMLSVEIDGRWTQIMEMANAKKFESAAD